MECREKSNALESLTIPPPPPMELLMEQAAKNSSNLEAGIVSQHISTGCGSELPPPPPPPLPPISGICDCHALPPPPADLPAGGSGINPRGQYGGVSMSNGAQLNSKLKPIPNLTQSTQESKSENVLPFNVKLRSVQSKMKDDSTTCSTKTEDDVSKSANPDESKQKVCRDSSTNNHIALNKSPMRTEHISEKGVANGSNIGLENGKIIFVNEKDKSSGNSNKSRTSCNLQDDIVSQIQSGVKLKATAEGIRIRTPTHSVSNRSSMAESDVTRSNSCCSDVLTAEEIDFLASFSKNPADILSEDGDVTKNTKTPLTQNNGSGDKLPLSNLKKSNSEQQPVAGLTIGKSLIMYQSMISSESETKTDSSSCCGESDDKDLETESNCSYEEACAKLETVLQKELTIRRIKENGSKNSAVICVPLLDVTKLSGYQEIPADCPIWKRAMIEKKNKQIEDEALKEQMSNKHEEERWRDIPEWKKTLIIEKQKKKQEEMAPIQAERERMEGEIQRLQNLPEWKRNLVLKKRSEAM